MKPVFRGSSLGVVLALALMGGALAPTALAQRRLPESDEYLRLGKPDPAEGRRVLETFRQAGLVSDAYAEFVLRFMPRRGAERLIQGKLWASRNAQGPVTIIELPGGKSARFLLQNGARPALWVSERQRGQEVVRMLAAEELFAPMADTQFTPFALQMPFLFWESAVYEGLAKQRGRPAHVFRLEPPLGFPAEAVGLKAVRAFLDAQFVGLSDVQFIGADDKPVRTMSVVELKRLGEAWMVRAVDISDHVKRDRTRLIVRRAATGLRFAEENFRPETFAAAQLEIPADKIRSLDE